jgi:hypothetical protein
MNRRTPACTSALRVSALRIRTQRPCGVQGRAGPQTSCMVVTQVAALSPLVDRSAVAERPS